LRWRVRGFREFSEKGRGEGRRVIVEMFPERRSSVGRVSYLCWFLGWCCVLAGVKWAYKQLAVSPPEIQRGRWDKFFPRDDELDRAESEPFPKEKLAGCPEGIPYRKVDLMESGGYFDDLLKEYTAQCVLDQFRWFPRKAWGWGMEAPFQARAALLWYTQLEEYALREEALEELRKMKRDGVFPNWWWKVWTRQMGPWGCHGCEPLRMVNDE
jgi:hypothetical protein